MMNGVRLLALAPALLSSAWFNHVAHAGPVLPLHTKESAGQNLINQLASSVQAFSSNRSCPNKALENDRVGFAGESSSFVKNRQVFIVDSADDQIEINNPEIRQGTLRWALARSKVSGGGIIHFDPSKMANATIILRSTLAVPNNTVIDGECLGVTISAEPTVNLFAIRNVGNVIIHGLSFEKTSYDPESKMARDAITVSGRFSGIWIDGNKFSRCGDGCIDVVRVEHGQITISRNLFSDHNKTSLFSNINCENSRVDAPCNSRALNDNMPSDIKGQISLFGNVYWGTSQRNPKVAANMFVHAVNNIILFKSYNYSKGRKGAAYGMLATDGGQIVAHDNIFLDLGARGQGAVAIAAQIHAEIPEEVGKLGFVDQQRNVALGGEILESRGAELVALPRYRAPPHAVEVDSKGYLKAATCIVRRLTSPDC